MKIAILLTSLLIGASAQATVTVNQLQKPVLTPTPTCVAAGFVADQPHGFCYTVKAGSCSGRGCQPTRTYQFYDTTWNSDTTVASSVHCGQWVSHYPATSIWTYDAGYSAVNCYESAYPGTGPLQIVYVAPWDQYAYYLSTSSDGVWGLWNVFGTSWIGAY